MHPWSSGYDVIASSILAGCMSLHLCCVDRVLEFNVGIGWHTQPPSLAARSPRAQLAPRGECIPRAAHEAREARTRRVRAWGAPQRDHTPMSSQAGPLGPEAKYRHEPRTFFLAWGLPCKFVFKTLELNNGPCAGPIGMNMRA